MLALGAAILMFTACSDDNTDPATDVYTGKKLARVHHIMYDTPEGDYQPIHRGTEEFEWDGDRLVLLRDGDDDLYRRELVYEGNLLVRDETYYDGELYEMRKLSYSDGQVSTIKHYRYGHLECTQDFIYGNDGRLQKIISVGDIFSESGNYEETRTHTLSWKDGNIVSVERYINSPRSGVSTSYQKFEYDNAPNPMRPMALVFLNSYCNDIEMLSKNNVLLRKSWDEWGSSGSRTVYTYDDGYPAKSIRYFDDAPENVHEDIYYEYTDGTGARPE